MQVCPAHTAPGARSKWRFNVSIPVQVADASERLALRINAEALQLLDSVWHQSFATGLVDWSAAPVDDDDLKPRPCSVQSGCEPSRAATRDK